MPRCTNLPHRPSRPSRPFHPRHAAAADTLIAQVLAIALTLLPTLLASCRPTSMPSSLPISWPSPRPPATSKPFKSSTPPPTRTAMPTVDPAVPLPVAMTLDEARAEVLASLDPKHGPWIVSADYIPGAALVTVLSTTQAPLSFDDFVDAAYAERLTERPLPPTIVRVVAAYEPLEAPVGRAMGEFLYGDRPMAEVPTRMVALFDATSGARLASIAVKQRRFDVLTTALSAPTVAIPVRATTVPPTARVDRPTLTPPATATARPTPSGPVVDADSVRPAFRDALNAYPLLPGSTWTWESTSLVDGVTWTRETMTETVTGAWQLDATHIVARIRRQRRQTFGPPGPDGSPDVDADEWRAMTAAGIVSENPAPARDQKIDRTTDRTEQALQRLGLPIEARFDPVGDSYWFPPDAVMTTRIAVTTPAGRFEDCGVFLVAGGQTMHSARAICPGIGYAETDTLYGGNAVSGTAVTWLVGFRVVVPR